MTVHDFLTFLCWVGCFGGGGGSGAGYGVCCEDTPVVVEWEGRFFVML